MADRSPVTATGKKKCVKKHSDNRPFPCTFDGCDSVFKKNAHLTRHFLIHNNERPCECTFPSCGKAFRSPYHLRRHEATHSEEKEFKCKFKECDVSCQTLWNLKRHVKRTHCGKFKCSKCRKEFKKNKLLQDHITMEHNTCCEFPGCGMVFSVPSKMRHHMKAHTQKGYKCSVKGCSMIFQLWSECRQHAAQCKNKEQSCEICGKVFTERSNLKAHMKVHSEQREVYQCSYTGCGRFYTKQSNLKVHVQSFHQNIRPFVCPKTYCSKAFHFQHLLRKHLELHAKNDDAKEVKPPQCKRKRPRRMVTSTAEALTGYVPALWKKMTPEEMQEYIEEGISSSIYAETDVIQRDDDNDETTQAELTPVPSGELRAAAITTAKSAVDCATKVREGQQVSEETLTAFTDIDQSEEEDQRMILRPVKSLAEACLYLEQNNPKQSLSTASSTPSSRIQSGESGDEKERKLLQLENTLKSLVRGKRGDCGIMESCRLQSLTESDSSDTETKKKVRLMMRQCAS